MAIKKPPIKPVPVQPPIEPPEVPEEELIEPVEEFPTTITEEGWEYSDIVWSEEGEPVDYIAISPIGEQYTKTELDIAITQQEDYAKIYTNYQRTGGTLGVEGWIQAGTPLVPALEVTPEEQEARTVKLITDVFPNMTPEGFTELITEDWGGFSEGIITGGPTPEKESLLREMGFPPEEIERIFQPWFERLPPEGADIIMEIAGVRTQVHIESPNLQVWARDILIGRFNVQGEFHPVPKGISEYLKETYIEPPEASRDEINKNYKKSLVDIERNFADIADWTVEGWQARREANPERVQEWLDAKAKAWEDYQEELRPPWERYFTAGTGDVIAAAAGVTRWMGEDGIADRLSKYSEQLQAQAPPDYMGEFEWSMMLNPRFYSTRVLRALPFTLSLAPAAIAGAYIATHIPVVSPFIAKHLGTYGNLILASIGGAAFSRPLESAFEAGTTYDEAIARGMTKEQADKAAMDVFLGNLVLGGWDAVQFGIAFIPIPGAPTASRLWKLAMVAGKLTIVGLTEAGEEAYQEVIQRWALDEEVKLDAEMQQVMAIGGIFGIGLGGVGDVFTRIKDVTLENLTPEARATFDGDVARFEGEGLTREQAELRAFDELAKTEEGGIATSDAIEGIKREGFDAEAARYREIIEARVPIPEVPLTEALIKEGDELVAMAEAIEPTNASVIEFRRLVEQAKEATPEVQRQVLVQMEALEDEIRAIAKVPAVPEVIPEETRAILETKTPLTNQEIEDFTGRMQMFEGKTYRESDFTTEELRVMTQARMRVESEALPPAVEVAKPPVEVAPEVIAERAISGEQTEAINRLAKEKLIMTEEGKTKPQLRRLMKALTGKNRINQLTQAEADLMIDAIGRLEVKYGRPPVIPTGVGLITAEFADKIPLLKEIGILEKVRPTRHVFEKMGLRQEVWKPAFEAEVGVYEEHQAFDKELSRIGKLVGKDPARRSLVFRELENPGSQVGLTFDEKRAVTWFRKYFNEWADRLNLPENKRRTNYVTHIFEEEISRQLKEKHPIDPELIKALDFITPKTVFNPYLQRRLGQTIGLREDPFAAATAYEARALKVFYYEPLIQRIRVYQKYLPPHSARYLSSFITRITDRPLTIDRELNRTVNEFADRVRGLPGGEAFANSLTRGNPGGMVSYNLTSVLYTLWLGFKPTSAIRNLGQHTLIIAETGPINFAKGLGLRVTQEGRTALKESLVLRSRRGAFIPAIDSSFASKWTDSFREKALWMFRFADKQNVSDAFLAGYAEAKELFPNAPRELWINRGDEVAADTQYLYTKFNSFSMSQNSIGRVFSMLTTWTENWMELMTKWVSRKPSQVYLAYTKETGQAMPTKNWSQTRKAILMYMLIIGLGYALKEKTRLKAWEYTGLTSLSYLADIVGGDFPALQAPGAVADLVVGFVTDDERRLKTGWNALKSTFIPSIMKQMNYVATGERDWLTLLLYLEGQDIEIKRLRNKWEKEFEAYPLFKDDEGVYDPDLKLEYIRTHPKHAGWSDAKIRNQWRIDNPLTEAKMFIVGQFTVLSSDEARAEVLRLIEEHKIDTELIDGYEKVFGVDTQPELQGFQNRLGNLEKLVVGEEAEYFTTSNFATEVNRLVNIQGRSKVERDGNKLAIEYLHATDLWEPYYNFEEDDARTLWRQQYPDVEALLYLFGKVSSFKNPKSAEVLLGLMKKYNIPPEAIRAFLNDPTRYDELFTQKFELEQKWFDQTTEYENFGNTEAPNYIEDAELRKEARAKFKEDNPDWVADMRRIEAIDNEASDEIMERWVDRGKTIDEFGAGSSQAKAWLLDNPEAHKWALEKELLTDDGSDWNEPVLRLNVKWHELDNRHEGFGDKLSEFYIEDDDARAEAREKLLATNADYRKDRYRRDAYGIDFPEIENYVTYYELDAKGFRQERYLVDNPEFAKAMHTIAGIDLPEAGKVPAVQYDEIYEKWQSEFDKLDGLSDHKSPHYIENVDRREMARQAMRVDKKGNLTEFGIAEIRRNGYGKLVPEKHIEGYVTYYSIIAKGKPANYEDINKTDLWYEDDWALIENPEFYQEVYLTLLGNEPKKLGLVPTRKIFDKYLEYVKLPKGKRRDDYRWENQDLDAWLVLKFDMVQIVEKRRRAELTPTEEFLEYVLEKETEFDEAMRELEELLKGLR